MNKTQRLVIHLFPVLLIVSGLVFFYTDDFIVGPGFIAMGAVLFVANRYIFKEENIYSKKSADGIVGNTADDNIDDDVNDSEESVSKDVEEESLPNNVDEAESKKAICPNCRALIPNEVNKCPICGTEFKTNSET